MGFWDSKIAPVQPELPRADGVAYRAQRRTESGSVMYDEPVRPQQRGIYVDAAPRTLADYASAPVRSKWEQDGSQSDMDYVSKLKPLLQHLNDSLPAAELERVAASYYAAVQRLEGGQTHAQLRTQLESRSSGTGIGVMGAAHDRTQAWGLGFSERSIEGQGHIQPEALADKQPLSNVAVGQILRERDAHRRGQLADRTDVSSLQSSGEGWHTR